MEKISVKKPFTILVAVIMVIVLGVVSVTGMTTDLLPNMSLPYLIVVTTYPGASPERVENDVVRPLESALGTVSGVKNIYSTSAENYGMVQLEFADGTDLDSTLVKVNSSLQEVSASLPDTCGTPSVIELSMDMMATMYVSVSRDGYDIYELSNFVDDTIRPFIERQNGVANVTSIGLVEKNIHVELNKDKIDLLNAKVLSVANEKLAEALKELEKAEAQVTAGKAELDKAQASFGETMADTIFQQIEGPILETANQLKTETDNLLTAVKNLRHELSDGEIGTTLDSVISELETLSAILGSENIKAEDLLLAAGSLRVLLNDLTELLSLLNEKTPEGENVNIENLRQSLSSLETTIEQISKTLDDVPQMLAGLETALGALAQAQLDASVTFAVARANLENAQAQLTEARVQYESAKDKALSGANLDQLLSINTLSQLIYAQNFSMPAGYIDDKDDNSWLLKIGDEFTSVEELSQLLLVNMDGLGTVRLVDVADITVIDNAGDSYARLNGETAVILSIFKNSVTGTSETASNCLDAFSQLEEKYPGTHIVTLMNQGSYIGMIIESVLTSMISGALLAIVILALFLKDVKPTIIVAISIPLSVLFSLVLMYFTNISLNMMTLSGLALGIGMLVDNSIVVLENIYRLRSLGISAPRAAVQGTKQVAGAIISSTLTTICVFLPLVFTKGMVKELLLPLGLCIGYCLSASLLVALTVVPAAASTILKKAQPKQQPLFQKFLNIYSRFLNWCLDRKAIPIGVSVALLAVTVFAVVNMGIVLLPDMTGNQIQVNVITPIGISREESYKMADDVIDLLLSVDGVDNVGVMDGSSTAGLMGGMSSGGNTYGSYIYYIALPDGTPTSEIKKITDRINHAAKQSPCVIEASAGGMDDLTAMLGSGLSVKIYGDDLKTLETLSAEVVTLVEKVEGYTNISTSFGNGDATVHLKIDRDKAMEKGLTIAQIYMAIAQQMNTSATSTTIMLDGVNLNITVADNSDPLTVENILELDLEATTTDLSGNTVTTKYPLSEFATLVETSSVGSIDRENQTRYVTVSADVLDGYNATLLSRDLSDLIDGYTDSGALPHGYNILISGESETVNEMVSQMALLLLLGFIFIYLVMVAQFQSLLSPFIVLFTIPLAFTGGMVGLLVAGEQLSLLSIMGFAVLMGTVVNNGIVFVDYTNQLRMGGLDRRSALIATGVTRMRPILMTTLTTILAMFFMLFSDDMAGELGGGMAIVIVGGLLYATLMTLIVVPVINDILFKREPKVVDLGPENLDDIPDDAAQFLEEMKQEETENIESE